MQATIGAVKADNKEEGGNINKTAEYTAKIEELTTALEKILKESDGIEKTAKAEAENLAAYDEVKAAIAAATAKRNEVRDALVTLLPSPVYADWQSAALAELTEQVTKVINDVEKSNEAANEKETATAVKNDNLQKLSAVTGGGDVDPSFSMCVADQILANYTGMKEDQEDAYAALNAEFKGKFDLFAPVKKTIEESTVEYLNADSTALSKAYQDVKASIDAAYKGHTADQKTVKYDDIDVLLAALTTAADKAKADYYAHKESEALIEAKQKALKDAIEKAKEKTEVGDYVAYGHFTKTSDDLQNKIKAEVTLEADAWSTTDKTTAGKAAKYRAEVETNLNKINITAYTTNTDDAKAYYTTAWNTIDAADKALNSTEKGALGLKETAKGDLTVTVDGNVGSSTYGDAIEHFEDQIGKLKKALTDAFAKTDTEHLELLETASKKEVADFVGKDKAGQDLEAKAMKDLTDYYLTNKTTFEANLKIGAADKILGEVEGQLKSAETELAQVINLDKDAPVADYEPTYGFKSQEIKDLRGTVNGLFGNLSKTYTNSKDAWDGYDRDAKIKNAPDVIASLNALKNDLKTLQASVTDLKAKAESAAKNKTAYDNVDKAIVAATNAISTAQTSISQYNKIVITDEGGRKHFNEILSSLTESKNTLANELKNAYETVKDTKQTVVENEEDFTNRAQQIQVEAGNAYNDFVQNEIAHKNHVDARDTELKEVQKLYDEISSEDETTAANDYLADLAKLQEQLLNMTNPAAKGIITEKLAAGLSKQDDQKVLDAIKAITEKRIIIRDTQLDEYKQNVIDDNDAELGAFDAAYNKAYKAFQEAVKTLNDYAAISYNDDVKAIAQEDLIATHDKIYGQAAPLLDQKTKANDDYKEKCDLETPEFFKSADYVAAVVAIENQINSDINAYVKNVNDKAAELANTYLTAAQTALTNAKTDATYTAFEYATRDKAFKYVEDLIALVEGKLAADPKFAVNLDKQNWLNDLKTVDAKIADLQEAAALAEYDHQLEQTNALVEAEQNAIKALGNIDTDEWLATFAINELKNTVTAATEKAKKEGVKYSNIDAIKALLAAFKTSMTDDGNGKLHTATYYDAKTANDAAGENAAAVTKLDKKIADAVKVVDELGNWLDELFVAHTSPVYSSITTYMTFAESIEGIQEGYTDQVKDGGAVGYLRRYQGILDAAANDAKDIKKAALADELNAVDGLIKNAEEKYNQYAKIELEGAAQFDGRMTKAASDFTAANNLYNKIVAGTETKKTYDDVKANVLTLESDIAKLDGELAKKLNSKVIANAHTELVASIQTTEGKIAAAKTKAQKYEAINAVFGEALNDLASELTNLSNQEAQLYTDAKLLMYVDNLNNDLDAINNALDDLKNSTAEEEGLTDMYQRFENNETYNTALKATLEGYQTELNRVKEAVADYTSISDEWKAAYVDEIEGMIKDEAETLEALYTGITAADPASGVNASTTIAQAQDIQDKTIELEYQAAGTEYRSLSNTLTFTVDDANTLFNKIVLGTVEGKRYNPATQKELASTLTELQNSLSHVADYAETLTEFGNNENNPYGYVDVDLNGAPIALNPVTDEPMMVTRYFLEAWYNEIHAALNTLIGGAKEVAGDVENRAFVLGDVNNNGVINVADYDAVRRMILSADMKKFEDAVALFGEVPAYAADVNEDKAIDVADLTSISNFIFNGGFDKDAVSKAARVKTAGKVMCDDVVTLQAVSEETTLTGKTMRLAVNVTNTTDYVNFQMDVQLPEGMTLVGESLSERANGHLLSTADLGNGAFRMVAENVENVAFGNQTNAVLYLDVEVSSNYNAGEVALSNIIFSDAKGNAYRMNGLTTNAPTGINEITAPNMKERIYSVGGQVMKAMKKGVNIIKGEGSVKKVVKK
ncbi:MAG: dockerin type I domain-containing protein [Prevotella sp.]|nr:dockerin type I domain-containing protein [Prevotella sp.]